MGGYACAECSGKKGLLQRKAAGHESVSEVPPIVHEVLRSPGQPLDPATRAFFEPRFGYDFSQVRMHTDTQASESAQAVSALAYTVGQDVVFGHYAPSTNMGRQLLAHELSHVIQQTGHDRAASIKQDFPLSQALVSPTHLRPLPVRVGANSDAAEQEADRMANQVMQQSRPSIGPTAFMGMHNFTPVLRRQGNIPEPKPDAREIMLRQLATRPQLVLQRWKSLSPSEQDQVLWNMIRLYGPPFTTEFQQYA